MQKITIVLILVIILAIAMSIHRENFTFPTTGLDIEHPEYHSAQSTNNYINEFPDAVLSQNYNNNSKIAILRNHPPSPIFTNCQPSECTGLLRDKNFACFKCKI